MQPYDDGLRLHRRNVFEPRVRHCHIKRCNVVALQKVAQVHPCCNALHEVAKYFCDSYRKSGTPACAKVHATCCNMGAHVAAGSAPLLAVSPAPLMAAGRQLPCHVPLGSVAQLPRQCCRKISAVAHIMLQGVA